MFKTIFGIFKTLDASIQASRAAQNGNLDVAHKILMERL